MKTSIIPQIKRITTYETKIALTDYHISQSVTDSFSRATEIFDSNGILSGEKPIQYSVSDMPKEAYRIYARKDSIDILAADSIGLMYGLFTLSELALINDGILCEFDAEDAPTLTFRALSDDISRGQISTLENFFTIIRRLARYKYNTYMPYIEDVFQFSSIPAWGRYSDPVGAEEWRVIIAYAKEWNISVRPIVNLLGHFDKLVRIKELQPLALRDTDGSLIDCMDPTNPEVRQSIRSMLEELVDCFGKGIMHCGGDEPVGLTKVFGAERGGQLFIDHYTYIHSVLKELGCSLMMYADFFAPPWGDYGVPVTRAKELPSDTDFVFWDYAAREDYPFVDALHRQNINLYLSPGSWTWESFACDIRQCYDNTKGLLKTDAGRAKGMIMSSWADRGDTLRELTVPGVIISANFCWNPASTYSYEEIYLLIHKSLYDFDAGQALQLDPIYHYGKLVAPANRLTFKLEMWNDPFHPVKLTDLDNMKALYNLMQETLKGAAQLTPKRNHSSFDVLILAAMHIRFTANKLLSLPDKCPNSQEEAIPYAEAALRLAGELLPLKELHRKLWFAANRNSEWELCATRYDDLYDQLQSFARNARLRRLWQLYNKA